MQPFKRLIKWKIQLKNKGEKMMKQFFILTAILFATFKLPAQTGQLQQANEAYAQSDFQTAAGLYEELLKANG
jgi:hypothetical protein